jgi:hypothetical protein
MRWVLNNMAVAVFPSRLAKNRHYTHRGVDECSRATTLPVQVRCLNRLSPVPPPAEGVRAARHAVLQVTGLRHESRSIGEIWPFTDL